MKKRAYGSNDPELTKKLKEGKLKEIGSNEGKVEGGTYQAKMYEYKKEEK